MRRGKRRAGQTNIQTMNTQNQQDGAALAPVAGSQACACKTWARCLPIDLTYPSPDHHSACPHYNDSLIVVWRVSLDGSSYVTDDKADADEAVALYSEGADSVPTVTAEKMHREVYENLPEFDGF